MEEHYDFFLTILGSNNRVTYARCTQWAGGKDGLMCGFNPNPIGL